MTLLTPVDVRQIERLRAPIYHISPHPRVRTMNAAARFINQVGFCWLFAPGGGAVELPSLFEAVKGRRGMQIFDWDEDSDRLWGWKSDLPAARRAYYGKAFLGRPVFISLEMLPYVLAGHGVENIKHLYDSGGISNEAKRVYSALESFGPQPTRALRAAAGLDGKSGNIRYHRALDDLQHRLLILIVGAANEGSNWPSQIYDLIERWYPDQAEQARRLDIAESRCALVYRYLKTVVGAPRSSIARLFGIPRVELDSVVDELATRRLARPEGDWLLSYRSGLRPYLGGDGTRGRP